MQSCSIHCSVISIIYLCIFAETLGDASSILGVGKPFLGNQVALPRLVDRLRRERHRTMKSITVVIPARNEEAVIVRTVASAVASAHLLNGRETHLDDTEV